jgi:predicted site-specific integrase-resolvase
MDYMSLSRAAKELGIAKSTLFEYIKTGKLKAEMNSKGVYDIPENELLRVFGSNGTERTEKTSKKQNLSIEIYQERLAAEQALRKSIENERDYLREQLQEASAERRMLNNRLSLLENQHIYQEPKMHKEENLPQSQSRLWMKLFGNKKT